MSPVDYGGALLKNRIIFAPTTMGLKEGPYVERIRGIAKGGAAMIIIGDVPVTKSRFVPSLQTKKGFSLYRKLTEAAHGGGALIAAQLHEDDTVFKGMMKYFPKIITGKLKPGDMREIMNGNISKMITEMPAEKVQAVTEAFGEAAELALKAGFDLVQVHGDRMCGAFSSSVFNKREDGWGGDAKRRAAFACSSVRAIRRRFPDLPIDYKLCIREEDPHYGNAGITMDEVKVFVPMLEEAGVTSFHVTLADHSGLEDTIPAKSHPRYGEEGCFLFFADEVRKWTERPVCGVGGLTDPAFIRKAIDSGRIDCAAMSRQLIADPEWPNKVRDGRESEIVRCVRCNRECLGGLMHHRGVGCIRRKERNR